MASDLTKPAREAIETYGANQISGATPGRLVLLLYDFVLAQLRRGEITKAKDGIVELMSSLDLQYVDVAGPLFRVYEYSLDAVRERRTAEVTQIFTELRQAWAGVIERVESGSSPRLEAMQV